MEDFIGNTKFEKERMKVHNDLYELSLSGAYLEKKMNDYAGNPEYANSFNANKRHAKWMLRNAVELGMLDDNSFIQVVRTFRLDGYVKSLTTSLSCKEQEVIGRIKRLQNEATSCAGDLVFVPRSNKNEIREYIQTALDAGMGDVYFIARTAEEYGLGRYQKDAHIKPDTLH